MAPPLERAIQQKIQQAPVDQKAKILTQQNLWPELLSAKELLNRPDDPTRWIWENCLPLGSSSLLVAKPKVGKSTFAVSLSICIARGWPFLARGMQQGTVAYLSLDASFDEIKEVFVKFGLRDSDPILVHAGQAPHDSLNWAINVVTKHQVKFLVVDTIQKMFRFRNINDYSEVTNAMEPLEQAQRAMNCHVEYLHHAGKESRDDLDSAIGSTALRGIAYTYLHLKRLPDSKQRIFMSDQRGGKNFDEIAISSGDDGCVEKVGTKLDAQMADLKPFILDFMREEERPLSEKEIKMGLAKDNRLVSITLRALIKANEIERTGKIRSFRYHLAGNVFDSVPEELPERHLFEVGK